MIGNQWKSMQSMKDIGKSIENKYKFMEKSSTVVRGSTVPKSAVVPY